MPEEKNENISTPQDKSFFRRRDTDRKLPSFFSRLPYAQIIHIAICLIFIILNILSLTQPLMERFEYVFLDHFYSSRTKILADPSIVIVEISEDGLEAIGRWPWARHYHAVLAHMLTEWGARAIVFDILFSEKSTEFDDGALKESIEQSGKVYLPMVLEGEGINKKWIKSLPEFSESAKGVGHINVLPDSDGKIRRIEPFLKFNGESNPHLALRVAADIQGESVDRLAEELPRDNRGMLMINWAGKWKNTFQHYSYIDLLKSYEAIKSGKQPIIAPEAIAGKVCFIGLTAFGQTDIKPIPIEPLYPALGVHANVLNSILTGGQVRSAPMWLNALCLFIVGIIASFLFALFRSVRSFLAGLALGGVWLAISFVVFKDYGLWLLVFHELILIFILYVFSTAYAMVIQNKERLGLLFLATRDGLTGLYVIRHFRYLLNLAVFESVKKQENLSVILIDVDHFKQINDTYGHQAGDVVLREISSIISGMIKSMRPRMNDVIARYGGEEIIIYLKRCSLKEASEQVAERIRMAVSDSVIHYKGLRISVTISLGVSTLHSNEHIPDLMVGRADKALYAAKHAGRNRVCVESEESEEASPAPQDKKMTI